MKKKRIILLSITILAISFISYATYEYSLAKKYALEICKMADNIRDKDEIIKRLPSEEAAKRKGGTIMISTVSNVIVALFIGALPPNRAICTMKFEENNQLQNAFYDVGN